MIKIPKIIIWIYVFLSFSGVFFALFPAGMILQKLSITAFTLLLLIAANFRIILPSGLTKYLVILLLLAAFSFLSSYQYSSSVMFSIFVVQKYIFLIFSFISVSFIYMAFRQNYDDKFLDRMIVTLIAVQFFFVCIKVLILGKIDEGFLIGSMHHAAGQLGFLFPALFIPLVIFRFLRAKVGIALILLAMLMLFGVLNEKRSIFYLGPIIMMTTLFFMRRSNLKLSINPKSLSILIVGIGILYYMVPMISSLSGIETSITSSSNTFVRLYDYAITYLTMSYGGPLQGSAFDAIYDQNVQLGRLILILECFKYFLNSELYYQIFGNGFGFITPSEYLNPDDILFLQIGIRGAINGAAQTLLEGGLVSLLLHSLIILLPLVHLFREKRRFTRELGKYNVTVINVLIVIHFIFIYDFFFYSTVLFNTSPLPLLYFLQLFAVYSVSPQRGI